MATSLTSFKKPFFIGIAGAGMSALAQYLHGTGMEVSGSDRFFLAGEENETRTKLEAEGIRCFPQNGEGITNAIDLVVASTAVEDSVPEMQKAKQLGIPVIRRSALLAMIVKSKKTIAIGGTSGKSTTAAMLFVILEKAGWQPSIITGAGLINLMREEKIGNAKVGSGEWLVIEADESDGSITQYHPAVGVLLNIDKDHQEIDALKNLFTQFKNNSEKFIVNRTHELAASLSQNEKNDFSTDTKIPAGLVAKDFKQLGFTIQFTIEDILFTVQTAGKHNMENALAAITAAHAIGVPLQQIAEGLKKYEGIYRRFQVYGEKNGVCLIDDYAHNPVKCAAVIKACYPLTEKIIAWFQPHGYKPTKFLREEFVQAFSDALRPNDEIWMSEIYYAGGTAVKDISAGDLVQDLLLAGKNAFFCSDRNQFSEMVHSHLQPGAVLLLMGARDPSLEAFAQQVWKTM